MSDFHEELDKNLPKKGLHVPNVFIFDFLKDITVEALVRYYFTGQVLNNTSFITYNFQRRDILYNLLEYSKDIFPELGPLKTSDYVFKQYAFLSLNVVYSVTTKLYTHGTLYTQGFVNLLLAHRSTRSPRPYIRQFVRCRRELQFNPSIHIYYSV